jgi:UDP-3-O-[3-hydroxymyristoyl] glucosamine N-acyltransferase
VTCLNKKVRCDGESKTVVISKEPISVRELLKLYPSLWSESFGDLDRRIVGVSSPDKATTLDAVFLSNPRVVPEGLDSQAGVLVVGKKHEEDAKAKRGDRTLLIAKNVDLAMATVISGHFLRTPYTNASQTGIHSTAIVGEHCKLGPGVRIGPHAFIGSNVTLAANVYIGANAVVEDETSIGEGTVIHPLTFIGHSTSIGKSCEIHPSSVIGKEGFGYAHDERMNHFRVPHQGKVVIEDNVHVGACVAIDRGTFGETRIRAGTKLDNHIHIAHNCEVGKSAIITAGFLMAGSSKIGANFLCGGNTMVTGHIEIGDNIQLAAASGVAKDMKTPGQYGGFPLAPLQHYIKTKAALSHLPEMRKQLSKIMKILKLDDDQKDI